MKDNREKLKADKEEVEKLMEEVALEVDKLSEVLSNAKQRYKALERQHRKIQQELAGQKSLFWDWENWKWKLNKLPKMPQ